MGGVSIGEQARRGVIVPVNKPELLAPWLGLAALASLATLTAAMVRKRRSA